VACIRRAEQAAMKERHRQKRQTCVGKRTHITARLHRAERTGTAARIFCLHAAHLSATSIDQDRSKINAFQRNATPPAPLTRHTGIARVLHYHCRARRRTTNRHLLYRRSVPYTAFSRITGLPSLRRATVRTHTHCTHTHTHTRPAAFCPLPRHLRYPGDAPTPLATVFHRGRTLPNVPLDIWVHEQTRGKTQALAY